MHLTHPWNFLPISNFWLKLSINATKGQGRDLIEWICHRYQVRVKLKYRSTKPTKISVRSTRNLSHDAALPRPAAVEPGGGVRRARSQPQVGSLAVSAGCRHCIGGHADESHQFATPLPLLPGSPCNWLKSLRATDELLVHHFDTATCRPLR